MTNNQPELGLYFKDGIDLVTFDSYEDLQRRQNIISAMKTKEKHCPEWLRKVKNFTSTVTDWTK